LTLINVQVGSLLSVLDDELGLRDQTFLLLSADHGPERPWPSGPTDAELNNMGRTAPGASGDKHTILEGGLLVPFLLRWRGAPAGASTACATSHLDLLPTIAALAGVDVSTYSHATTYTPPPRSPISPRPLAAAGLPRLDGTVQRVWLDGGGAGCTPRSREGPPLLHHSKDVLSVHSSSFKLWVCAAPLSSSLLLSSLAPLGPSLATPISQTPPTTWMLPPTPLPLKLSPNSLPLLSPLLSLLSHLSPLHWAGHTAPATCLLRLRQVFTRAGLPSAGGGVAEAQLWHAAIEAAAAEKAGPSHIPQNAPAGPATIGLPRPAGSRWAPGGAVVVHGGVRMKWLLFNLTARTTSRQLLATSSRVLALNVAASRGIDLPGWASDTWD